MYWTDLAFDCDVPDDRVQKAWATAFGVAPEEVTIVADIAEESPWTDPRTRIGLERRELLGEFPLHLMAILRGADIEEQVATREDELTTVRRLCAELDCRALVSTENIDPYEWLLVTPDGQMTVVDVDTDQLDDANAFVVSRVTAASGTAA